MSMNPSRPGRGTHGFEDNSFHVVLVLVSLAFAWIIEPMFSGILWGSVAAILFAPLNRRLLTIIPRHPNLAAFGTVLLIVLLAILPAILLAAAVTQELSVVYAQIQSGRIDFDQYFREFQRVLPGSGRRLLSRFGLTDLSAVRERLGAGFVGSFEAISRHALGIGQSTFSFVVALGVMLYLTFFLMRDEQSLLHNVGQAMPLHPRERRALAEKFVLVVRATIKGGIVVGIVQGAIGGFVFWLLGIHGALLWGVLMAVLSLLPTVGTALVWGPVAIYLLLSGAVLEGLILILCGLFVIGLVDNLLRPILVGRDARVPDYVVLVATLGGIEIFGFNGFIVGPIIAAMFIAAWSLFTTERLGETLGRC
ncbi:MULTISPECIES: AI-2E family transporter [Sphingobium]|jgi:predicted PurR-regulated permease PerM|uniref:Permease n=3 Tax=Sphingobium TaxID=165695 RepID=T0IXZ2_9SPHN|nr:MULTISPECIES: AI-2E family transporter [Sphingobium]EQB16750.1 hypothetical protein RLDS_06430 [Sphingobium lactosutens DS20]